MGLIIIFSGVHPYGSDKGRAMTPSFDEINQSVRAGILMGFDSTQFIINIDIVCRKSSEVG